MPGHIHYDDVFEQLARARAAGVAAAAAPAVLYPLLRPPFLLLFNSS